MKIQNKNPIIFCDFDGTITEHDVIQMIMEEFAPPEWKQIVSEILDARTLSIKEGVSQLFQLLPSTLKQQITEFVLREVKLRGGFHEFMTFCNAHHIPFLVVSGGVDFFIKPILHEYLNQVKIFSNIALFNEEYIQLEMPYLPKNCIDCNDCACCKQDVMRQYDNNDYFRISIGDSLTDLGASKLADLPFARARLISYAQEANITIQPFETFTDIQHYLEALRHETLRTV